MGVLGGAHDELLERDRAGLESCGIQRSAVGRVSAPRTVTEATCPSDSRWMTSRPATKASTAVASPTIVAARSRTLSVSSSITMRPSSTTSTRSRRFETSSIR